MNGPQYFTPCFVRDILPVDPTTTASYRIPNGGILPRCSNLCKQKSFKSDKNITNFHKVSLILNISQPAITEKIQNFLSQHQNSQSNTQIGLRQTVKREIKLSCVFLVEKCLQDFSGGDGVEMSFFLLRDTITRFFCRTAVVFCKLKRKGLFLGTEAG